MNFTSSNGNGFHRWMRAAALALAAVATVGVLAGCDSGSSSAATAGTANSVKAAGSGSSKAPFSDAEACGWLKEKLPTLPESEFIAMAQLTVGLATFFEEHGGLEHADGYAIDDAFSRGCPALHTKALKKAGIESFGNL